MNKKINLIFVSILITVFFLSAQTLYAQEHPWTFMVYMAADDESMDAAIADLDKLSEVGSSDSVAILVMLGDTETNTAQYGYVQEGNFEDIKWDGEVPMTDIDMGDPDELVDFVLYYAACEGDCLAENYALILWNAAELYPNGKFSIQDVEDALYFIDYYSYGDVKIHLIGFDGGSMGMLEAAYEIKDWADVMVASEKDQPLGTWPYNTILNELVNVDTQMTAAQLSQVIVDEYGDDENDNEYNTLSSILLAPYSTHDLAGDWYINYLRCGSGGECEAAFGGMNIDERGNVQEWYGDEFESPDPEMPTKIYIDSNEIGEGFVVDGVIIIDSEEYFVGFMSPDKKTVTATITDDDGSDTGQIFILQKRGEGVGFGLSDLAGDWEMHSFRCDGEGNCGWSRGEANVTSDGLMTWVSGTFEDSEGEEDTDSYQLSINWTDPEGNYWNGIVTVNGEPFGAMSQDKNMVVGTIEGDEGDPSEFVVLQRKSSVQFYQANLEGLWSMQGLTCDVYEIGPDSYNTTAPFFVVGIEGGVILDIETGTPIGAIEITDTGVVSMTDGESPLPVSGTMSPDKEMIVFNGGEGDGADTAYEFFIFQRIRYESPVQSLANAVSDFAYTAFMEEHDDWDVIFTAQQRAGLYRNSEGHIFRDLGSFMQGVSDYAKSDTIFQPAYGAKEAFDQCIIARHGPSEYKGLSIYLPRWWWDDVDGNYNETNLSFLQGEAMEVYARAMARGLLPYSQSWDEFLGEYIDADLILDPNLTGEATFSKSISGGTSASNYVMLSSPLYPDSEDPLLDNLGDCDTELWRAFRWLPETGSYDEYPFPAEPYGEREAKMSLAVYYEENYMDPGNGLWLISRNDAVLNITGNMEDYYGEPYGIYLEPGWNQIATPFNFQIDWDLMDVYFSYFDGEVTHEFICGILSDENEFTSPTLWKYSNGNYSSASLMIPGESYWIYNYNNDENAQVYLLINPVRRTMSNDFIPSLEQSLTFFARLSGEPTPPPPPGGFDGAAEDNSGSGGGSSGCFIATASFGSPMAGEVNILRDFRDIYLLSNPMGKLFVSTYYKYSPKVADFIARHDFLKTAVRTTLYPIVKSCGILDETSRTN